MDKYNEYLQCSNDEWWSYISNHGSIIYKYSQENDKEMAQLYKDMEEIEDMDINEAFATKNIYTVLSCYLSRFMEDDIVPIIDKFVKLGGDLNKKYYYQTDIGDVPIPLIYSLLEYQKLKLVKWVVDHGVELPKDSIFHFFMGHGAGWCMNVSKDHLKWFFDRGCKYDLDQIEKYLGSEDVEHFKTLLN